jgi:hypothetical protein
MACLHVFPQINDIDLLCVDDDYADQAAIIASLEAKIRIDEESRKKLHNTIQELKGNIRVYARIRPSAVASSSCVLSLVISLSLSLPLSMSVRRDLSTNKAR